MRMKLSLAPPWFSLQQQDMGSTVCLLMTLLVGTIYIFHINSASREAHSTCDGADQNPAPLGRTRQWHGRFIPHRTRTLQASVIVVRGTSFAGVCGGGHRS